MSVLAGILVKENILSESDLENYCMNLTEDSFFTKLDESNVNSYFGAESQEGNRINIDEIVLKNLIIDLRQIEFKVYKSLRLTNCIVVDKMRITESKNSALESILIDNCIFLRELDIINIKKSDCDVSVYHTNTKCLSLINLMCEQTVVHGCKIFLLSAHDLLINQFEVENNEIRHFEIDDYQFNHTIFDYSQIKMKHFSSRLKSKFSSFQMKAYHDLNLDINLFEFRSYGANPSFKEEAQYKTTFSTLAFLKEHTEVSNDKNSLNAILFLESLLTQKTFWRKLFIGATGGFLQPGRFLMAGLFVVIGYGLLYMLYGFSASDAFYFSGITFTTIGYGDINPMGFARVLAVSEGVFGIIFTSAFLVALVKKYVD